MGNFSVIMSKYYYYYYLAMGWKQCGVLYCVSSATMKVLIHLVQRSSRWLTADSGQWCCCYLGYHARNLLPEIYLAPSL